MILTVSIGTCLFSACGGKENHSNRGLNPGVGPFDSRGNYVESWADDRSKGVVWRKSRVIGGTKLAKTEKVEKAAPPEISKSKRQPVAQIDSSSRKVKSKSRTRTVAKSTQPKPKSRSRAKKAQVKSRPSSFSYKVKKGDTLYGLSLKYKTSVALIQRANGMSGTNLRIGRALKIPTS